MYAHVYVCRRAQLLLRYLNYMKKTNIRIKISKSLPRNSAALPAKMRQSSSMTNRNEKRSNEPEEFDVEDFRMTCKECNEEYIAPGGETFCLACCCKNDFCLVCGKYLEDDYMKDICSLCVTSLE